MRKGEQKYMKEFDAEYFARTMRKVNVLIATTMDDKKRFLTNFQQFNVIWPDDNISSSSDDEREDQYDKQFKKVPKLNDKRKKIAKYENKVDEFMVRQLQWQFQDKYWCTEMDYGDLKLISGVYTQNSITGKHSYLLN